MKTLLARMKTVLEDDSTLSDYVAKVETVPPNTLPLLDQDLIPFIGIAPVNSPEEWRSTGKKDDMMTVEAYLVNWYMLQEYSLIGDDSSGQKGLLDLVTDFKSAIRGNFFASAGTNYLSKPTDITGVEYSTAPYGDDPNIFVIVATVTMSCVRLFNT